MENNDVCGKQSIGSTYENSIDLETYRTVTLDPEIDTSREKMSSY